MATQYIHVRIGTTDAIFPVRALIATGILSGYYEYQQDSATIAWIHRRWCTPCTADGSPLSASPAKAASPVAYADAVRRLPSEDTDWRSFLRAHWDTEHNHLHVDSLTAFMAIFTRAAAAYIEKKQAPKPTESTMPTVPKEPQPVASVAYADAVRQPKPKVKPHYVELSLFPDL